MDLVYSFDESRFRLGRLCKHGHAWPGTTQSLRRIDAIASNCMGCTGRKNSSWLLSFLDYEAMGWPKSQTLGKLCPSKHDWNGLGVSLRKHSHCVECAKLRKAERSRLIPRKTNRRWDPDLRGLPTAERRKQYKRKIRQKLRQEGLTSKGTAPARVDGGVSKGERALYRAISNAGLSPSVARLVMNEQRRYWRSNPEARLAHDRQWARDSWWLKYQTDPELRFYVKEKSHRRKAQERGLVAVALRPAAIIQRFSEFDYCCAYCGSDDRIEIEHVRPISKGGAHDISNIVPACHKCNASKRVNPMEDWYRSQPFFSELRLRKIQSVTGDPEGQQLAFDLADLQPVATAA